LRIKKIENATQFGENAPRQIRGNCLNIAARVGLFTALPVTCKDQYTMKKTSKNPFLGLTAVTLGLAAAAQGATVLQFGGTSNIGANGGTPQMDEAYGDNVTASNTVTGIVATVGVDGITGTPDIAVAYNPNTGGGNFDSYPNWNTRGHVLQTDYSGTNPLDIVFTPTINFGVLITSFDLDEYAGGGASSVSWSIKNGATTIVSGTWTDFITANGGRSTVNTGMTKAQAVANAGSPISLVLTLNGGIGSYQAMDNLAFDQVIPEPSSAVLSGLALGALALRRRRA
jgi:hypothetical protein